MTIYFINIKSTIKGPFFVLDTHSQPMLKIGDLCVKDTEQGVYLYLVNTFAKTWSGCKLIGISKGNHLSINSNMLLYSFDGMNQRYGRKDILQELCNIFLDEKISSFFKNGIDILDYKADSWEASILQFMYASTCVVLVNNTMNDKTPPQKQSYPSIFFSYLPQSLLDESLRLFIEGKKLRDIYLSLKEKNPMEFREALKAFLKDNPHSTIYDNH